MKSQYISVIVPVYNAEKTLRQCIDSILGQEYKDFELLLIDDGSKDNSPAICDEYASNDSRVRVFHKKNGGVSSARNVGLDNAKGEWITFIDSDDYITQGYLENINGHEEDVLIKGYKTISMNGLSGGMTAEQLAQIPDFQLFLNQYITKSLLRGPVYKFYKKGLIGELRFLLDMRIGEDAYFVFKYLSRCNSFAILPNGEYIVRLADKPDEVKYAIAVDYALQSLSHLKDSFDDLVRAHNIDRSQFLSYIAYFKSISVSDWQNDKEKWYGNQEVKAMYLYVWSALSFKQKCRIISARYFNR